MNQQNVLNYAKVIVAFLLKIALVILGVLFLFFLPDIIVCFRNFSYEIIGLKYFELTNTDKISASDYIENMLLIISGIITVVLAIIAHKLSKKLGQYQVEERTAKQMFWAVKVHSYLVLNLELVKIYSEIPTKLRDMTSDNNGNIHRYMLNLFTTKAISRSQLQLLQNCLQDIEKLCKIRGKNSEREKYFVNKLLELCYDQTVEGAIFSKDFNIIINVMKNIYEGEDDCE